MGHVIRLLLAVLVGALPLAPVLAPTPAGAQTGGCPPASEVTIGRAQDTTIYYAKRGPVWYVRGSATSGPADLCFVFGNPGDIGVMGDWDGDTVKTPGVFRPSTGTWYISNSSFAQTVDGVFRYGSPGDIPIAGDWDGDGVETLGVFRDGLWYATNRNDSGIAEGVFRFGDPGDRPLRALAVSGPNAANYFLVYRPQTSEFFHGHVNERTRGVIIESARTQFGNPGDIGLFHVADRDTLAVFRSGDASWHIRQGYVSIPPSPPLGVATFSFGDPGDQPLVSDRAR